MAEASSPVVPPNLKNYKWVRIIGLAGFAVAAVYAMIYHDVVSRAKESYLQGERYLDWYYHPEKKKEFFEFKFNTRLKDFNQKLARKKISPDEYSKQVEILRFDQNFSLEESSLKYAYQWFKDTYELFSPPESKWVKLARTKAPEALALWKKELDAKNIPYQDTMFE